MESENENLIHQLYGEAQGVKQAARAISEMATTKFLTSEDNAARTLRDAAKLLEILAKDLMDAYRTARAEIKSV